MPWCVGCVDGLDRATEVHATVERGSDGRRRRFRRKRFAGRTAFSEGSLRELQSRARQTTPVADCLRVDLAR